ncbi:MAG TPA: DUF1501 domain-containing protein [Methylomirabilota bacterium]|nr:DUF1501 domain-containing protein [Methylomirabilota bacterium]
MKAPFPPLPDRGSLLSRRHWITRVACGMGGWALLDLLEREGRADLLAGSGNPFAAKSPHFPGQAKSVIFLMMAGGPSQMETFDPKPLLNKLHGERMPESFGKIPAQFTDVTKEPLLGCKLSFRECGQAGIPISEAFPHLRAHADRLAVIRSCYHDAFNHSPAQYVLTTGQSRLGFPSVGAWVTYGLGSESDNLPALVVLAEPDGKLKGGTPCWGNGFLPAIYQGAPVQSQGTPILYLNRGAGLDAHSQRKILDLSQWLNRRHSEQMPAAAGELDSRIAAYELAFRMQSAAPEAVDIQRESEATRKLYGIDNDVTRDFGVRCLIARRLVERGVRFVQVISGSGDTRDWDHHDDAYAGTLRQAKKTDQPIAALLHDLASRGLLDQTLIVWSGEFGRTPTSQSARGRDHNPNGFTMWMAGGGIRGGQIIGATDEIGLRAVEDKVHIHDAHATILSLLGLDHRKLTYLFQGREHRLTDVGGNNDLSRRLVGAS